MKLFLTSSPSGALDVPNYDKVLDESNNFVDNLKQYWKEEMKGLIITASPDDYEANDEMCEFFYTCFENSGVPVECMEVWDHRCEEMTKAVLHQYDIVLLGGGHVPTQNAFFHEIRLKEMIQEYEGIIIGISAGTMNCAEVVYAQPELPGESIDPDYEKFMEGLGLTDIQVCPHYQIVKDTWLDGRRLYEDITYSDSIGNYFIALVDGSYIMCTEEETRVYGEAYLIHDQEISLLCEQGNNLLL